MELSMAAKTEQVRYEYLKLDKDIFAAEPATLTTAELSERFKGLYAVWYFLREPQIPARLESVFQALSDRGAATALQTSSMQDVLLESQQFAKAAEMIEEYPTIRLNSVPEEIKKSGEAKNAYRYYSVGPGLKSAELKSFELPAGPSLIVYGDPYCHFTSEAIKALSTDNRTASLFPGAGTLVTARYNFNGVSEWNATHVLKFKILFSVKDWPVVTTGYMPAFIFLKDGQPVCYAHGWREEQTVQEILACAKTAGFEDTEGRIQYALRVLKSDFKDQTELESNIAAAGLEYRRLKEQGAFSTDALSAYSTPVLEEAYDLLYYVQFYSPLHTGLSEMAGAFAELEKRGLLNDEKASNMSEAYLDAREFEKAAQLKTSFPRFNLPTAPIAGKRPETGAGEAVVYSLPGPGAALKVKKINKSGKMIVASVSPGCKASRRAIIDLESDPKLFKIFKKSGLLLLARSYFGPAAKWNKDHELDYLFANSADWPELDFDAYPVFYFFDNGKVVYRFSGWPDGGNRDELYKGLGRLGFIE
ncbi:MAG: hypothetical protein M0025_09035 [Elusimicrobia bacterium]|nr:hypothetical protein [Elusimicrobiota bacterium]